MIKGKGTSICARLHHLRIASPDPARMAEFARVCLQMQVEQVGEQWRCRAPGRLLAYESGPAKTLIEAGYALQSAADLDGLKRRLAGASVAAEEVVNPLLGGPAVSFRDPDGNRFSFGLAVGNAAPGLGTLPARLQHVVVGSTDAERIADFLSAVVGMEVSDRVLDDAGQLRTAFLRTDEEHHSFAVFQASKPSLDHHSFETADWNSIRDWADHFSAQRVQIQWGPGRHGPGNNLFIFIHDPDGNWLEFSADLELIRPGRPTGVWPQEERSLNLWGKAYLRS
jgi:catechol 2,3-dioxygenase-like lactoylglutathione lyase family enzyme